ncbi:hypothetical protein EG329_013911 [Mollisiaceae sp. DMI_Dod_QoI]|nr:hypothetical protein EG329_013911 [Helotiales sp. DMI_Dod_QoI]
MSDTTEAECNDVDNQRRDGRKVISSYLRTLDGSEHPALDSLNAGVIYDYERAVFVVEDPLESLYDQVKDEAGLFTEALKSYEAEVHEKYKTGHDVHQACSIKEVVQQIDSALNAYRRDSERTIWEVIRKGFWRLSECSDALENWLKLLPSSNDYCSVIYGGISLILKAAARIGDVRNEAFDALAKIPDYLENTRQAVNLFSNSESLRRCGVKLYTVTIVVLRHILEWFKKRAIGKAFGAFLKQSSYGKHLQKKVEEMEIVSTRFKDISMSCMQREIVNTNRTVKALTTASVNNDVILKNTFDQAHALATLRAERTNESLKELSLNTAKQHENTQQVLKQQQSELVEKVVAETLNTFQTMLDSIYDKLPYSQLFKESLRPDRSPPPYIDVVRSSTILEVLRYEKDLSDKDLANCLRGAGVMSRSEQDRAVWVMKSSKLRDWLTTTSSSALLINGNCASTTARSPISSFCARLIESLQENRSFKLLQYFCGEHISSATDKNASPMAIMNSLLGQLLLQYPDFEITNDDLVQISQNTVDSLASLFAKLVAQLPPTAMLFCIIDGISLYEDPARLENTKMIMCELAGLLKAQVGPVFKLMLTSATKIRHSPECLSDDTLAVPRQVPRQGLFSSAKGAIPSGNNASMSESGAV